MKFVPLLLAFAAIAGAQAPQAAGSDCAMDGSVVNAVTGEPIARAHVTLQGTVSVSTTSDSSGKWTFTGLPCASATLIASRPGFLPYAHGADGTASAVHDFKIELTPQSVFTGTVSDDQGDPVMGAQVVALAARITEGRIAFQRVGEGSTNDLGEYRIAGMSKGKYVLCADPVNPGLGEGMRAIVNNPRAGKDDLKAAVQELLASRPAIEDRIVTPTCYPGPVEAGIAGAVDVAVGREAKLDFTLGSARAVHVRGTITGLRNGGIRMIPAGANGTGGFEADSSVVDGNFDFRVGPGSYVIAADIFESGKHLFARMPVQVGSSDVDNVAVVMETPFTLQGDFRVDGDWQQGSAPPRPLFAIRPVDATIAAGQIKWDPGRSSFSIVDVMPGNYRLGIMAPANFYIKSVTLAGLDILNTEFALAPGLGPIDIVLGENGGTIEGDIVNSDGQPVSGGAIALRGGTAGIVRSTGHFKLLNLAPGDYKVYAWDDPSQVAWADDEWMRRYASNPVDVSVSAGQTSQVKLTRQNVPQ